jgi:hypothetical protein
VEDSKDEEDDGDEEPNTNRELRLPTGGPTPL